MSNPQLSGFFEELLSTEPSSLESHPVSHSALTGTNNTPLTVASTSENSNETSATKKKYQMRTLGNHNINRLSILPIFPHSASSSDTSHLLLSNVHIGLLTDEQFARIHHVVFPQLFKLDMERDIRIKLENTETIPCESFFLCFYQSIYVKMRKRLKADISIIDFNFTRLLHCIDKVVRKRGQKQTTLNLNELSTALEFYLQIDVDMFFLKTCSFNGVKPRRFENRFREGLFCVDIPEARFAITPCNKQYCLCCHSQSLRRDITDAPAETKVIPFSTPHIHRFVNQYEAILNCPATCQSTNCIYVLTCPCGQFDFIGHSKGSFAETLAAHRAEANRIIREFLIGETNIEYITHGVKSSEKRSNDQMWLYQHSSCCSVALQLFFDHNPDYWCLVPMKLIDVNLAHSTSQHSSSTRSNNATTTSASSWNRTHDEIRFLLGNVPKPPLGFDFSFQQRQQQDEFFKWAKDCIVPFHHVDVYNADILAILPANTSELFNQLIESLFITHAECKLNELGHLVYGRSDPNYALHNSWCVNLTRRS